MQFVLGMIWYGPLWGKAYMDVMDKNNIPEEEIKKIQKEMGPYYGLQILLSLITSFVLFGVIYLVPEVCGARLALLIWLGFVAPTQIGAVIWGNTKKDKWFKQILIMLGYSLLSLVGSGYILEILK
jgi:hypothetical protein